MIDKNLNSWDIFQDFSRLLLEAGKEEKSENLGAACRKLEKAYSLYGQYFNEKAYRQYVRLLLRLGEVKQAIHVLEVAQSHYPDNHSLKQYVKQAKGLEGMVYEEIIFKKGRYRMFYYKQKYKSRKIIITFGGMHSTMYSGELFGLPFLVNEGYDYVYISQSAHSFYQGLGFDEFKEILVPYCEGKDVITYGSSLGGYCAIYFAGALNAQAIASGPRLPPLLKKDKQLDNGEQLTFQSIGDLQRSTHNPIILYDDTDKQDGYIIQSYIMPYYPNAIIYRLTYAGHESLQLLLEAGVLKEIIKKCINQEVVDLNKYDKAFKQTLRYKSEKGKVYFSQKNYKEALPLLLSSLKQDKTKQMFNYTIKCYQKLERLSEANQLYKEAIKIYSKYEIEVPVKDSSLIKFTKEDTSTYHLTAYNLDDGRIMYEEGNQHVGINLGMGHLVIVQLFLEAFSSGRIELTNQVKVSEWAARSNKAVNALGLNVGEVISVKQLFDAIIIKNAPDAIIALAEKLFTTTRIAIQKMKVLQKKLNLNASAVKNVTGRLLTKQKQCYQTTDLLKLAIEIFSHVPNSVSLLNQTKLIYKQANVESQSVLISKGIIQAGYFYGDTNGEGIALTEVNGKKVVLTVIGAFDAFNRDYLIARAVDRIRGVKYELHHKVIKDFKREKEWCINIVGDTYFGEDYTKLRERRGISDALSRYGYEYSFQKLRAILQTGNYNIVNFEAALTDEQQSPHEGVKGFILKGKGTPSVKELKNSSIDAVTLGNNHTMDYGEKGLYDTLHSFEEANIDTVGAGRNSQEANEPIKLLSDGQDIYIYNSYWYRNIAHYKYDFYALGNEPGVNSLSGELIQSIYELKQNNPNAYVIVINHWGVDWKKTNQLQKKLADELTRRGADLIIGHGAHMMQSIAKVNEKWVIYGIGNGVFNSNGEYDKWGVPPYSFIAQVRFGKFGYKELRLYPLYTNNLHTYWQPHLMGEEGTEQVMQIHRELGSDIDLCKMMKDEHGSYLSILLNEVKF